MNTKQELLVTQEGYYLTISECPLMAWEARYEKGYSAIRRHHLKDSKGRLIDSATKSLVKGVEYSDALDYEAWDVLFIDFTNRVKLDEDYEIYSRQIDMLINKQHEYIMSIRMQDGIEVRNRLLLNEINRLKTLIEGYEKTLGKGQTINKILMDLSKLQGYQLKKQDLTVEDYFDLLDKYKAKS